MKNRKISLLLRILFVVVVVLIFIVVKYYNCIVLELSSIPGVIAGNKKAFLLYGSGICSTCPPGKLLMALKDKKDILYVVPGEFSETDIFNLKDTFMLKGNIKKGDQIVVDFLKKIAACNRFSDWRNNIYMEITENGGISKLRKI
ncbi:MAG: hypothetical protein GTO45_08295 [Candidatus Aminicenantes bacterium]|nr:hypothetical protein [Candidatus Aminicenantes bacterium]NIM78830.1 hypothetical protein [Candidatus Aminicenantes bacterium]NIN18086.1 hypothetical protein [Candidatus Aminicenantes bacterium]NIN41985.1 hypothetical protein [Candidatus Aminicenantes bacterium]NIN84741.1 hypothetical protein [Candidatus Aminicenantes bacterium]